MASSEKGNKRFAKVCKGRLGSGQIAPALQLGPRCWAPQLGVGAEVANACHLPVLSSILSLPQRGRRVSVSQGDWGWHSTFSGSWSPPAAPPYLLVLALAGERILESCPMPGEACTASREVRARAAKPLRSIRTPWHPCDVRIACADARQESTRSLPAQCDGARLCVGVGAGLAGRAHSFACGLCKQPTFDKLAAASDYDGSRMRPPSRASGVGFRHC